MRSAAPGQGKTISRRTVLALAPGLVALRASSALAQRPAGPARIGWVSYVGQPDPGVEKLRLGLGELGHVEGKSYVLIPRYANGDFTRIPTLVDELMVERIDVLVSRGPTVDYLIWFARGCRSCSATAAIRWRPVSRTAWPGPVAT